MSSSAIQTLPPAPRPVRKPFLAAALSMLLPGVGLIYVGAILPALAFLGLWVAVRPLLALLLAAGAMEVGPYLQADGAIAWVLRVIAAAVSFVMAKRTAARPLPVVPPGVYGLSLIGTLGLYVLASRELQEVVPAAQLSADSFGLRAGEYVMARKAGSSAAPVAGALALYLLDPADAGPHNPAAPTKRDAYVGRIAQVSATGFAIDGLDASMPLEDYLGEPLGVILSYVDGGYDRSRLGAAPVRGSTGSP